MGGCRARFSFAGLGAHRPGTGYGTTNNFSTNFVISTVQFPPIFSGTNTVEGKYDPVYPSTFDVNDPRYCGSFQGIYKSHMGDYDTAVSDNNFVYYCWFDGRNT